MGVSDPVALKAEAVARLKELEKEKPEAVNEAREPLDARLKLLDEWERATAMLREAEHPEGHARREVADLKRDLEAARTALARAAKEPGFAADAGLPGRAGHGQRRGPREMKAAIDVAAEAAQGPQGGAGPQGAEPPGEPADLPRVDPQASRRARGTARRRRRACRRRDRRGPFPGRDRLINERLEERVVGQLHEAIEAAIALEARREPLAELRQQLQAAERSWPTRPSSRCRRATATSPSASKDDLARKAAAEQDRSVRSADPLERYRARRAAEMLDLESHLLRDERALAARPDGLGRGPEGPRRPRRRRISTT